MGKNVVVIGGGTGSYTVLRGLKKYPDLNITAIVSMADDGGSTGKLRDEYGVLPPGDIRRCIVALSEDREMMQKLFEYRFSNGTFNGHSFGNLLLTALKEISGNDENAIIEASKLLNIRGNVLPVTLDDTRLITELEDGQLIVGETNIDVPKHDTGLKIKRVLLSPKAIANQKSIDAILGADLIILGPGDLFGSLIANLLVEGISDAIARSSAKKVYVCNLMTKNGETNNFNVTDFVYEIENYLGKNVLDYVVYSDKKFDEELLAKYAGELAFPVRVDAEKFDAKFISRDVATEPVLVRHDSEKLARVVLEILEKE